MHEGFNVRVYGILLTLQKDKVLLVHERINGVELRKFPGGGVEHLEAPGDALKREFREELGLHVELEQLVYASPNFHRSYFRPQQLVGLYWRVRPMGDVTVLKPLVGNMTLIWQPLDRWDPLEMTHSLDQEVARHLLADCGKA